MITSTRVVLTTSFTEMWYLPVSHCVSSQVMNDRLSMSQAFNDKLSMRQALNDRPVIQFNDRPVNETVVIYDNKKINAIEED